MSLRKLPCLTAASLAARRANALKSTGPRSSRGKARVALNPLKHGQRAKGLQERLARAGYQDGEALYCRIRSRLSKTFARPGDASSDHSARHADRLANWIWVFRRELQRWEARRAKLECALESATGTARLSRQLKDCDKPLYKSLTDLETQPPLPWQPSTPQSTQVTVRDCYRRIGIVFYTQQRRYFTQRRSEAVVLGLQEFEPPSGALEQGLRWRVYRLARPRMWERLKFCLDRWGGYHPEWAATFRRVRREWKGTDMEVWLEPHPIQATMRRMEEAGLL